MNVIQARFLLVTLVVTLLANSASAEMAGYSININPNAEMLQNLDALNKARHVALKLTGQNEDFLYLFYSQTKMKPAKASAFVPAGQFTPTEIKLSYDIMGIRSIVVPVHYMIDLYYSADKLQLLRIDTSDSYVTGDAPVQFDLTRLTTK